MRVACKELDLAASDRANAFSRTHELDPLNAAEQHTLFSRWLAEHVALLHHVANGFAEGADRHDLMQELMVALWRAVPAFRGAAQPSTFIYRVAYNTALTWKRGQSNYRRRVETFEAEMPVTAQPEAGADAQRSTRDREALALMYAEIRALPPIERSLLLMHLDDVSYAGMAEVLGMSESAIGARLTRVKQRLISTLKEKTHELR
ncbi:MAG: sigma-70 family RNA polymerase sigma factor [Nibricoccus sp.]